MVSRSPEPADLLGVRKRDGRLVGFDGARLAASLRLALAAAGTPERGRESGLAEDFAGVVVTYLKRHAQQGVVSAAEIAELADQVLRGAGCENAALAYRHAREERERARSVLRIRRPAAHATVRGIPPSRSAEDPEAWSKGRVTALLSQSTELPGTVVDDIAATVERSLFASGLHSVGAALLHEWIDNELELRGHPPRLGQQCLVALSPHELRSILADGAGGSGADAEVSRRLFTRYALTEVFPADVRQAHETGLLGLESLNAGSRLDTLVLAPWKLPLLAGAVTRRARLRACGPLLRHLSQFVSREVLLDWDGPPLAGEALTDLLAHVTDAVPPSASTGAPGTYPSTGGARLVFCLRGAASEQAAPFLDALAALRSARVPLPTRLPCLRLPAAQLDRELLERALQLEAADDRVQFGCGEPRAGVVGAAVAVNVARLALAAGPRRVREFLDSLSAAVTLALSALSAQDALAGEAGGLPAAVARATGLPASALPRRRRLALSGVSEAAHVLLGDGPRGRANRVDLAAAIGERLSALLRGVRPEVGVGLASGATNDAFGRLDLAAFPAARDLLPLAGHRAGYRYDGALVLAPGADAADAGHELGSVWLRLGLGADAPVPRCAGSSAQRLAFLLAFLPALTPVPDLHPCG